jgi:prepilin-type N-terminal cleavage/methylation domain-containing protein
MHSLSRSDGFTLSELLISTTIMLIALGGAVTTFKSAMTVSTAATQTADANQNLRAGMNLLVRDLLQAARGIPTGGIPLPSGAGSQVINRPCPPPTVCTFDNVISTTLPALITGNNLGPVIDGQPTDIITMLMTDTLLGTLTFNNGVANQTTLAANGTSLTIGTASGPWLAGNVAQGIPAVAAGDLMWFANANASALQTVTSVDATHAFFANTAADWFNFNQPAAAQGSITQLLGPPIPQGTVIRILMYTYYVDATTTIGTPRLTKVQNAGLPQALAGVVEDLNISYDLVDGVTNPINIPGLPVTIAGVLYSPNQVRKVNVHVGVRSDTLSAVQNDYIRNHLSTVVSIRSLAFVNRYK